MIFAEFKHNRCQSFNHKASILSCEIYRPAHEKFSISPPILIINLWLCEKFLNSKLSVRVKDFTLARKLILGEKKSSFLSRNLAWHCLSLSSEFSIPLILKKLPQNLDFICTKLQCNEKIKRKNSANFSLIRSRQHLITVVSE